MPVHIAGWGRGSWDNRLPQLRLLGDMLGFNPTMSSDELYAQISQVSSTRVFAESVQDFLKATDMSQKDVVDRLFEIEQRLGLLQPLPFMSMMHGLSDPRKFRGIAIWTGGTVSWMDLRLKQIKKAREAGAQFECVIGLGSSRICNSPADLKFYGTEKDGRGEPTERTTMEYWARTDVELEGDVNLDHLDVWFPEMPTLNDRGKPLSLEEQLRHISAGGYLNDAVDGSASVYVPSNPNALYVPLLVKRVLGLQDVYLSQSGARLMRTMPDYFWQECQDVMTTPNGILRLWRELRAAECLTR